MQKHQRNDDKQVHSFVAMSEIVDPHKRLEISGGVGDDLVRRWNLCCFDVEERFEECEDEVIVVHTGKCQ